MKPRSFLLRTLAFLAVAGAPGLAWADSLPAFTFYDISQSGAAPAPPVEDRMPIMVTYELKRQRDAERIIARNPKAFWIRQIMARIEASKLELAKPLNEDRTVRLNFVVARDGHLVSKAVETSSGSDVADKTAIAMLERAQPFPPMPETMSDSELTFNLPVRFR